jgi:hypothetical protein
MTFFSYKWQFLIAEIDCKYFFLLNLIKEKWDENWCKYIKNMLMIMLMKKTLKNALPFFFTWESTMEFCPKDELWNLKLSYLNQVPWTMVDRISYEMKHFFFIVGRNHFDWPIINCFWNIWHTPKIELHRCFSLTPFSPFIIYIHETLT